MAQQSRTKVAAVIKIVAVLCSLANPQVCHEQLVTSDQFQPLTLSDCSNMAALAEWMRSFPQFRLARWRCQVGERGVAL